MSDMRAAFASDPHSARPRVHPEPPPRERTPFQRDRDRIIHSGAFRKLEYKTQVFVNHEGDYYRTRLTHSLEVAQIARSIARSLRVDEDLAEALALAHDLGHPPFGHAGEQALDEMMRSVGGFDHNDQTFRVLTLLERRYADFDGLNLSWETLEGTAKHNGPLLRADGSPVGPSVPETIAAFDARYGLSLDGYPSAEAQAAALSDDIAYNNHDIEDGLRAGLFEISDLAELPLVGDILSEVGKRYPNLARGRLIHETIRRMIGAMIEDLLAETRARIDRLQPADCDAVRRLGEPLVTFSAEMQAHDRAIKTFLMQRMYRHFKVNRMMSKTKRVVRELFQLFVDEPECLPQSWQEVCPRDDETGRIRVVADYIAGMTDRFAFEEHNRLFDIYART